MSDSKSLIEAAGLSVSSTGLLINNLNPVAQAGAQGAGLDALNGDEVTLYVRVIDQSSSMQPFELAVVQAADEQLAALKDSKASDSILMSTLVFDTKVEVRHSYLPLDKVPGLVYGPSGQTALYDAVLDAITSAVAYAQSLIDAGIRTKIVVVVISDGEHNATTTSASAVRSVVEDLLKKETWTFAFVAFGVSGKYIAAQMGFPDKNVLEQSATMHDIRVAFETVSRSVFDTSRGIIGSGNFFN